jgi:hypothetical protein
MRLRPLLFGLLVAAAAWSVQAQTESGAALDHFQSELSQQCPQKQLNLLSARDLRDGLDDYVSSADPELRDKAQQAERDRCSSPDAGAACVNQADLDIADQAGRIDEAARAICGSFLRCKDQGSCDYAR